MSKFREKKLYYCNTLTHGDAPFRVKYHYHFCNTGSFMDDSQWWHDGVIYQIYPRSFADSNEDGLGDLPGITSHLDYLADLGVDAIWLSPIYPTPDRDFGYDICNYVDIDARFGTMADFDRLVARAHFLGLRVIMDMVMNHTSDQHDWFKESRSSRNNPKRDWYIWKDPRPACGPRKLFSRQKAAGSPPNNWQASFGGKAWEYDPLTGQYYLHLFTKEQPDVDWRNPAVRRAQLEAFRFWMERGVDGFRLDVFNAYFKHADFPDNPPKFGLRGFDRQRHKYDIDQPEMISLLSELRRLLDSYPQRYAVGETYFATLEKAVSYCGQDKLHAAFSFDFTSNDLVYPWRPRWIMEKVCYREAVLNPANIWPTTVMSNHDLPRAASRYCQGEKDEQAKIAMALLLTLRGTPFMYYGEEIGMRDIHLRRGEILDPPGKKYWPIYKGRDGCRSPMQWDDSDYAGFSTTQPWLPVHPDFERRNVASQKSKPDSIYNFTKGLLHLRREHPALRSGDFVPVGSPPGTIVYQRLAKTECILVGLNFTSHEKNMISPEGRWEELMSNQKHSQASGSPLLPFEIRLLIKRI
jgi:alpha-glucosidase